MKMKFRLRVYADEWHGRTCRTGKQIKQKTFYADGWDDAERKSYKFLEEWNLEGYGTQLSVLK